MTTFTTEDRIFAEKDGSLTVNLNAGEVAVNKDLTDEEIVRISETCDLNHVLGLIDFARAILRKAQEK